jgi:hypothetical protein
VEVVVPGVLPIGCFPLYLTLYGSSNQSYYDGDGCLKRFNDLSSYHNQLLRRGICDLQRKHAGVRLMYGDFYSQVTEMVRSPVSFGKHMLDHGVAPASHS